MNNVLNFNTTDLGALAIAIAGAIFWGGKLHHRIKIVEDRQFIIERKIDSLLEQTTARIDDCKNSIIQVILETRK